MTAACSIMTLDVASDEEPNEWNRRTKSIQFSRERPGSASPGTAATILARSAFIRFAAAKATGPADFAPTRMVVVWKGETTVTSYATGKGGRGDIPSLRL
eukprot:GFKZ01002641.1.p2 GENE.GFKZ01002641.1~~GFKZ01002641.1.p2  ORF type:complete len:100 (+),score=9.69 GFKZ01002641.1:166-465(+)